MMTFLYFLAGFLLLFVFLSALMARDGTLGVRLFGIVFSAFLSGAVYMILTIEFPTWAALTITGATFISGWFFPRLFGLLLHDSVQKAPINR